MRQIIIAEHQIIKLNEERMPLASVVWRELFNPEKKLCITITNRRSQETMIKNEFIRLTAEGII